MVDQAADLQPATAIERDFPVERVNRLAAAEAYNKHHYRPTNYQHKWWARRLGSVFRTLCIAALSDADASDDDVWDRYHRASEVGEGAVVFDPFMGGGTTGQEATRLGARFVGADLNPVAWFVARMGLAPRPDDLQAAYEHVLERSRGAIEPYYRTRCPSCGAETGAQFYLWVRLVDSEDGHDRLEAGDGRAEDGDGRVAAVGDGDVARRYDSLVVDHDRDGGATVVCPSCHALSTVSAPETATCEDCGHGFDATAEDVTVPISNPGPVFDGGERPAYEPYAVKYDCDCGAGFAAFDGFDADRLAAARARYREVAADLPLPDQRIPEGGAKTRDLHNRDYRRWTDLFNDRQLLALGALLRAIRAVEDPLARQYLALTFSAALEFNAMFCSYKGADPRGPGAVRHLFSHHAFVHPGEPLENNPLGTRPRQSGTFPYLFEYRLRTALDYQTAPVERVLGDDGTVARKTTVDGEAIGGAPASSVADLLSKDRTHYLHCGDSATLDVPADLTVDAVVTDPPYFDSVQYGELADYFYVWLRRALAADFPDAFDAASVVSAAETVGNRTREKSIADYGRRLERVFETCADVLAPDGPLVFTFHHKDPDAWAAVLEALDGAGFRVVATYPVRGENRLSVHINGQRAIQLDSAIVCRQAPERPPVQWATLEERIRERARDRLGTFRASDDEDLSLLDATVVVRGACLTEVSGRETVRDDEGPVSARAAMARVETVARDLNEDVG